MKELENINDATIIANAIYKVSESIDKLRTSIEEVSFDECEDANIPTHLHYICEAIEKAYSLKR